MPRFALMNGEGRIALQRNFSAQNRIDSRERRFGGTECRFKPQYSFSLPLDFDPDTGRIIKDEAGQMAFKRGGSGSSDSRGGRTLRTYR